MDALLWTIAVLLILTGVAGTVLPALPGAPLVFAGLLLGAWIDNFEKVGGLPLTILAILSILSLVTDVAAAAIGAKKVNASRQALLGAALGAVFGLFAGLGGLIFGPFIGAAIGEFVARKDVIRAGHVGFATWVGMIFGVAAKLALCFAMVGIFITAYFWK
jgi:uncharacterized protein